MKRCPFCGGEYSDEIELCPNDHTMLQPIGATAEKIQQRQATDIPAKEQLFWQRMTFREFAALLLRIQALWLFFYALVDATYLSRYAHIFDAGPSYAVMTPASRLELLMLILRIILHIAVAVAVIQNAEKLLSWIIKDSVSQQTEQ